LIYCLLLFTVLFVIIDSFNHLDDYVHHNVSIKIILTYYYYLFPSVIVQIVPISVLVSILFGLGNLSKHNEIIALKASGVSGFHILSPYIFVGILISLSLFLLNETTVPRYTLTSTAVMEGLILKGKENFEERSLKNVTLYGKEKRIYFAREFEISKQTLHDVVVLEDRQGQTVKSKLTAERAQYENSHWIFYEAMKYEMDNRGDIVGDPVFSRRLELEIPETPADFVNEGSQVEFMTAKQLRALIHNLKGSSKKLTRRLWVDFHQRVAFPFISLMVILIGAPLAVGRTRGSVMRGIGTSFVVVLFFYGMNSVCLALGKGGYMEPPLAAWFANLFFALVGFYLIWKAA
jgi:lipopolysaccharide export system permease protein